MKRRIRARSAQGASLAEGRVEEQHRGVWHRAFPIRVETATVEIFALVLSIGRLRIILLIDHLLIETGRVIRLHRRTADFWHQQAAGGECLVTHEFTRQAEARATGDPAVVRIALMCFGRELRALPIGLAGDHQAQHGFHIPPAGNKFRCQPVDQFRMARRLTLRTKILRRAHQTGAKQHLPIAIDGHTRGQRIRRIDQPARQPQTTARKIRVHRGQCSRGGGGDLFPRLVKHAAPQNEGVARFGLVHHQRDRNGLLRLL